MAWLPLLDKTPQRRDSRFIEIDASGRWGFSPSLFPSRSLFPKIHPLHRPKRPAVVRILEAEKLVDNRLASETATFRGLH